LRQEAAKTPPENDVVNEKTPPLKEEKEEKEEKERIFKPELVKLNPPTPQTSRPSSSLLERIERLREKPAGALIAQAMPGQLTKREPLSVFELLVTVYPDSEIQKALEEVRPRMAELRRPDLYLQAILERRSAQKIPTPQTPLPAPPGSTKPSRTLVQAEKIYRAITGQSGGFLDG